MRVLLEGCTANMASLRDAIHAWCETAVPVVFCAAEIHRPYTLVCHYRPGWSLLAYVAVWQQALRETVFADEPRVIPVPTTLEVWLDEWWDARDSPVYADGWDRWRVLAHNALPRWSTVAELQHLWAMVGVSVEVRRAHGVPRTAPTEIDRWIVVDHAARRPGPWMAATDAMNPRCKRWYWAVREGHVRESLQAVRIRWRYAPVYADEVQIRMMSTIWEDVDEDTPKEPDAGDNHM